MSQIYKIINLINKKIYIGKSLVPNENYYGSGLQIIFAIEKYGKENFFKEILEECSEEILDRQEIYWIEKLDACNPLIGYNISIGGTGGNHYWKSLDEAGKQELRNKISVAKTGAIINYTDEQRKNVKAGLKKFWEDKKDNTEWLRHRGNSRAKRYILSNETDFIRIKNLEKYSRENNLDSSWLISIATGKKFTPHREYYCIFDTEQSDKEVLEQIQSIKDKQKEILDNWLEKTRNREKYECQFCKKMVTKPNLIRWHNDNCKEYGKNNTTDTR
jgi:hypothetical protein